MTNYPSVAPTEALARELLLSLDFMRDDFKAYHRAHPTAMTVDQIRAAIRREHPRQLAALEAKIAAGPPAKTMRAAVPSAAISQAVELSLPPVVAAPSAQLPDDDARRIAAAFSPGSATGGVNWDSRTQTQTFTLGG